MVEISATRKIGPQVGQVMPDGKIKRRLKEFEKFRSTLSAAGPVMMTP